MTEAQSKLDAFFREAEMQGTWCDYVVWCMGEADSGFDELDQAIADLYTANETLHRIANKLALHHDVDFFEGSRP
jgi:hypothetical protein